MRGKVWRKATAAVLSLLIVAGALPFQPASQPMKPVSLTASALGEVRPVIYVDENGETQNANATVLTGSETTLASGVYAVTESMVITHDLLFNGDAVLILVDDCTLQIKAEDGGSLPMAGIVSSGSLTICSEKFGGASVIIASQRDGIAADSNLFIRNMNLDVSGSENGLYAQGNITLQQANVTVSSSVTGIDAGGNISVSGGRIVVDGESEGLHAEGSISLDGGHVTASGNNCGMYAGEDIPLGYSDADMSLRVSSYDAVGNVTILDNCTLTDGTNNYTGILTVAERMAMADQTLSPLGAYSIDIADTITHGSVTASKSCAFAGEEVTITIVPEDDCQVISFRVNGLECMQSLTPENNAYTYRLIMPEANVSVDAELDAFYSVTQKNGNITFTGLSYTYRVGDTVKFTATPHVGYEFRGVLLDGVLLEPDANGVYSFVMPAHKVVLSGDMTAQTSGTCGASAEDQVNWALTDTDGDGAYDTLTISGTGAMADFPNHYKNLPWAAAGKTSDGYTITRVIIEEGVTHIGNNAFNSFNLYSGTQCVDGLREISIPASVESIGDLAIASCMKLETITIGEGSRLTAIGDQVLGSATSLQAIQVPADRFFQIWNMENGTDFQQYLRAEYSGEHFSWTLQGSPEGTASLNVTPDTGYTVKSVTLNDAAMERDTSGAFTFTVPSDRMDLAVNLEKLKYTVTWENGNGTVLETDGDAEYGTLPTYDGQQPTKAGHLFLYWSADGETPYDLTIPVTGNLTLQAVWLDVSSWMTFTQASVVTDNQYDGVNDRDYVRFDFAVNMDHSEYTVVQHGILYGMNAAAFGNDQADENLRFTDETAVELNSRVREFAAQNTDAETSDWIEVYIGDNRDGVVYARGFILVSDDTNQYLVYTDVVSGSYNTIASGN